MCSDPRVSGRAGAPQQGQPLLSSLYAAVYPGTHLVHLLQQMPPGGEQTLLALPGLLPTICVQPVCVASMSEPGSVLTHAGLRPRHQGPALRKSEVWALSLSLSLVPLTHIKPLVTTPVETHFHQPWSSQFPQDPEHDRRQSLPSTS